ncbi:hypothetical protein [Primorskyibacter sp. 2E233]|uniref:hypothetical protein n=1 Tax=Primorskyibacter sp. 2E233 TaxID=3413431 RepID=UPI003BEFAD1D
MPGYFSEFHICGGGSEFIELAIPTGTDTSSDSVMINAFGEVRTICRVQSRAISFVEMPDAPRPIKISAGALGRSSSLTRRFPNRF